MNDCIIMHIFPFFAFSKSMVAFLIFHAKIGLSTFMEVLSWHIRFLPLVLAAVPAQMLAPLALSLRATIPT